MRIILYIIFICLSVPIFSKPIIKGKVFGIGNNGDSSLLSYSTIYWSGTNKYVSTNDTGYYQIETVTKNNFLIARYVGYQTDTIEIQRNQVIQNFYLKSDGQIETIEISKRAGGTFISGMHSIKTEVISQAGLQKLACCNLSESFENNASVDVGYPDALTGSRQISMLGLSGIYTQVMLENIPYNEGLSTMYGISYIPGTWMESIQISKGTASVLNGFESVTGQINLELQKPENTPKLFLNAYGNSNTRTELNLNYTPLQNDQWGSLLMGHISGLNNRMDFNKDGFLESPLYRQVNLINRWKYQRPDKKLVQQLFVRFLDEWKLGGQNDFSQKNDLQKDIYGFEIKNRNIQVSSKTGYMIGNSLYNGLGLTTTWSWFETASYYGFQNFDANQSIVHMNLVYQTYLFSPNHKLSSGVGFQYDLYKENYNNLVQQINTNIPGGFGQYTYSPGHSFTFMAGIRSDYFSDAGWKFTPRLHLKSDIFKNTILRFSIGRGIHNPKILAENLSLLISSRTFALIQKPILEEAWNTGINLTRHFHWSNGGSLQWTIDFYRTYFQKQNIVDTDSDPTQVLVYKLDGKSYSNSFQTDIISQPLKGFEITAAYRLNDVQQQLISGFYPKTLIAKHRALLTISYATRFRKWQFDLTSQWNGKSRLPDSQNRPLEYQLPRYSDPYQIIHFQTTRRFKNIELYAGIENLTGFTQKNPIIGVNDPLNNPWFDASNVWGPVMGRMFYTGIRWTIN